MGFDSLSRHIFQMIEWLASERMHQMLQILCIIALLWFSVWFLMQTGVPSHPALCDHAAHMYKAYAASKNLVTAVHWSGENIFVVSPVLYAIFWLATRFMDYVTVYKVLYVALLMSFAALSSIDYAFVLPLATAWGIASVVVGRFAGLFAHLFGFLAAYLYIRKRLLVYSIFFVTLSIFSQPTVGLLYSILLMGVALDRSLRDALFLLLPFVLIGAYGLLFYFLFPSTPNVVRSNILAEVTVNSSLKLLVSLINNAGMLMLAVLSAGVLLQSRHWYLGMILLLIAIYFLVGWIFLPSWFPLAKVFPSSYTLFFAFVIALFRQELRKTQHGKFVVAAFSLYVLFGFILVLARILPLGGGRIPILGVHTLPHTWHNTSLERDLVRCGKYLTNASVYIIYNPDTGKCGNGFYLDPIINLEYNARTPCGGILEIVSQPLRGRVERLVLACKRRNLAAMLSLLSEQNAVAIVPKGIFDQNAICCGDVVCVVGPVSQRNT